MAASRPQNGAPAKLTVLGANNSESNFKGGDELCEATIASLVQGRVFVDSHRAAFVKDVVRTLDELQRGLCAGRGNCFVLGGERGVGKSTLLRNLVFCAALHLPPCMVMCYVNLNALPCESGRPFSPVEYITGQLFTHRPEGHAPPAYDSSDLDTVMRLQAWLREVGLSVLLVVDEVDVMYQCAPTDRLAACMSELYALGDIPSQRSLSVVLSGTSSWLRRLVFQRCGDTTPRGFPGYSVGLDLNSTKYVFHRLRVMCSLREQARCLTVVAAPRVCKAVADNEELALALFMRSRGLVGVLTNEAGRLVGNDDGEPARGAQPVMIDGGAGAGAGAGSGERVHTADDSTTPIESQVSGASGVGGSVRTTDGTCAGNDALASYLAQCNTEGCTVAVHKYESPLAEAAHTALLQHVKADAQLASVITQQGPLPAMPWNEFLLALGHRLKRRGAAPVALLHELEDAGVVRTGHEIAAVGVGGHVVARFVVTFPHTWMLLQAAFKFGDATAAASLSVAELASLLMPQAYPASRFNERLVAESIACHTDKLRMELGVASACSRCAHLRLQQPTGVTERSLTAHNASPRRPCRGLLYVPREHRGVGATLTDARMFGLACEYAIPHAGCGLTLSFGLGPDGCGYGARHLPGVPAGAMSGLNTSGGDVTAADSPCEGSASEAAMEAASGDASDSDRRATTPCAVVIVRAQVKLSCGKARSCDVKQWITALDNDILVEERRLAAQGVDVDKCRFLRLWWVSRWLSNAALRLLEDDVAGGKGLLIHRGNMRQWWSPRVVRTLKSVLKRTGTSESPRCRERLAACGFQRTSKHKKHPKHNRKKKERRTTAQTQEA